jgi:hypothetical protein
LADVEILVVHLPALASDPVNNVLVKITGEWFKDANAEVAQSHATLQRFPQR